MAAGDAGAGSGAKPRHVLDPHQRLRQGGAAGEGVPDVGRDGQRRDRAERHHVDHPHRRVRQGEGVLSRPRGPLGSGGVVWCFAVSVVARHRCCGSVFLCPLVVVVVVVVLVACDVFGVLIADHRQPAPTDSSYFCAYAFFIYHTFGMLCAFLPRRTSHHHHRHCHHDYRTPPLLFYGRCYATLLTDLLTGAAACCLLSDAPGARVELPAFQGDAGEGNRPERRHLLGAAGRVPQGRRA